MGGGVSIPKRLSIVSENPTSAQGTARKPSLQGTAAANEPPKQSTSIDARIIATLSELNLKRRAAPTKGKALHFERIVLKFALVRDAFTTLHTIYHQFANEEKQGLDFDGLKAALNTMGAHMNESDMREIFYESDMVRDNSLSQNEFVVSLAIAHLLGLITNFDSISSSMVHAPEDVTLEPVADDEPLSARDGNSSKLIAKALDLMVTAYLLFDEDASGTIQTNEVLELMRQHSDGGATTKRLQRISSKNSSQSLIRDERIKELDFDQDGTITFQEFVLTFQQWVGDDEDDEE